VAGLEEVSSLRYSQVPVPLKVAKFHDGTAGSAVALAAYAVAVAVEAVAAAELVGYHR